LLCKRWSCNWEPCKTSKSSKEDISHPYDLKPFRPWSIFPWENNLILWQRRDFVDEKEDCGKFRLIERFFSPFIG
jgi:hypothetical protein